MINKSRRQFIARTTSVALAAAAYRQSNAQVAALPEVATNLVVELPRCRVPLSFIIDDSTCLVNMGKFCMPQFSATYPEREDYRKPWQDWPDEIPDAFVREFGSWCAEHGVKGKYSIVPYPACVGWLDRTLPGWSQKQLTDSLTLVRELMLPNWDIHPEMITHTRAIDLKTGRPFADYSPAHMENSYPQEDVSVDYLASYLAYALRILKNCDLPCEGITTPGGFGNRVKSKLPHAVFEAVRDVYNVEVPHYFKYVSSDDESTDPVMEPMPDHARSVPRATMNVPAGTGDWFGGWEGATPSQGEKYSNTDATSGRMVDLIEQRRPAIMLCHWPGMYCNGEKEGFHDFQRVVMALNKRFAEQTVWMKVSEIGNYWAAKGLTQMKASETSVEFDAPIPCQDFTVTIPANPVSNLVLTSDDAVKKLYSVSSRASLNKHTYFNDSGMTTVCLDLPRGKSVLQL